MELEGVRFLWATVLTQLLVELAAKMIKTNKYVMKRINTTQKKTFL